MYSNPTFLGVGGRRRLIIRVDEKPIKPSSSNYQGVSIIDKIKIAYVNVESDGQLEILDLESAYPDHAFGKPILSESTRNMARRKYNKELLLSYISHLRIVDLDGNIPIVEKVPTIFPSNVFNQYGCEDPRATNIQGQQFILYTGMSRFGATTWMAKLSTDLKVVGNAMIFGPDHKHSTLFPRKIQGAYFLLTRPLSRTYVRSNGIWLFRSSDTLHWGNPSPILMPRSEMWDSQRVGPAASPQLIDNGWLLFYYGVDEEESYRVGAALLDANNPSSVIARTEYPILTPNLEWEKNGRRADIVFTCGFEFFDNQRKVRIFYGATDTFIGLAEVSMTDLLNALTVSS